jgi:hypothetical protein
MLHTIARHRHLEAPPDRYPVLELGAVESRN